jgi:hypothetical protein
VTDQLPLELPALPFRMHDAEILSVAYRSTPQAVARFVPAELTPLGERVLLHFYASGALRPSTPALLQSTSIRPCRRR